MLLVAAFIPFIVLATRVAAYPNAIPSSPISLRITKQINAAGIFHPSQRDQKRWINLVKGGQQSIPEITDVPLNDFAVFYSADIGVGDPPTFCGSCQFLSGMVSHMPILDSLLVDTGSSNTWLGANQPYNQTETSVNTDNSMVSIVSRGYLA
jgi:cathepsin E